MVHARAKIAALFALTSVACGGSGSGGTAAGGTGGGIGATGGKAGTGGQGATGGVGKGGTAGTGGAGIGASGGSPSGGSGGAGSGGLAGQGGSAGSSIGGTGGDGGSSGCTTGYSLCNGQCIDTTNDISNCGACGNTCASPDPTVGNGFIGCKAGKCTMQCFTGYSDCDAQTQTGCEAPISVDPKNCGVCGQICDTSCNNGVCKPEILASNLDGPVALALDANAVYFAEQNAIDAIPKSGGTPALLAPANQVGDMVADSANVYWTDSGTGLVERVPIGGGSAVPLSAGQQFQVYDIAVDATNVYFTTGFGGSLQSVPVGGGTTLTLGAGYGVTTGVVVVGGMAYFAQTESSGSIWQVATSGGVNPAALYTGSQIAKLVNDATYLYFAEGMKIERIPLAGGAAEVLATLGKLPMDFAVDNGTVFVLTDSTGLDGQLLKIPSGGSPYPLVSYLKAPARLRVDGTHVYWTDPIEKTLRRIHE